MAKRGEYCLRQLTLYYCRHGGSSRGIREFIETGVADFAKRNPQIEVRTSVRSNRHPYLMGFYPGDRRQSFGASYVPTRKQCIPAPLGRQNAFLSPAPVAPDATASRHAARDRSIELGCKNVDCAGVEELCESLRARSGAKSVSTSKLKKWWFTQHPSIQGMWKPGMFRQKGATE